MLGVCNLCVKLQSRVTSSGATIDGLIFYGGCGGTKYWGFYGRQGESINWKVYWDFFGEELGIIISDDHTNWEVPWFGRGLEKHEAETCGCGKNFMDGY